MTQVSKIPIKKRISERIFEIFTKVLIATDNKNDAQQLIADFFTPTEKIMLAKRLAVSLMLEKEYDYRTIRDYLKISTATIASVNTARQYGNNGYRKLMKKIMKDEAVQTFFEESIKKLTSIPASSHGKGTGVWKKLKYNLNDSSEKKPF